VKPSLLCAALLAANLCGQDDAVRRIQREAIGVDSHLDTIQWVVADHADLSRRNAKYHVDFPRLREGGVRSPYFALWVPAWYPGSEAVRRTLDLRDAMQRLLDQHPDQIELALNASDVERIAGSGRIAAVLTIEGGHQIAGDLSVLRIYHRLGIRSMTLAHFEANGWCDSSTDTPRHNGLTEFGKTVVREMNRIGMIVDVSHVSDKAFRDTLAVSTKPVIASHSSCRALSGIPRNLTDGMLRALARNGGVAGINFGASFVNAGDGASFRGTVAARNAMRPNLTGKALDEFSDSEFLREFAGMKPAAATIGDVAAHIDHAVKVAGIDHVGIGSDFDGISSVPKGLEDISKMPALVRILLKKGYSEKDLKKIFGGNHLRVLREVTGQ
jgi:membrane dipeptidase